MLQGCSSKQEPETIYITKIKTVYIKPPANLVKSCTQPMLKGNKWKDCATLAKEQHHSIDLCNARIDALKEWLLTTPTEKPN